MPPRERGERGGKKVQRSKRLAADTLRGSHTPTTRPSSEAGLSRIGAVEKQVVFSEAASPNSAQSSLHPTCSPNTLAVSSHDPSSEKFSTPSVTHFVSVPTPKVTPSKRSAEETSKALVCRETSNESSALEAALKSASIILNPKPARQECWISVDFNGCLNVSRSGDQETDGIHPHNRRVLLDFFEASSGRGFRIGITSYIGQHGPRSVERRANLLDSVRSFNQEVERQENKVGVRIVERKEAKALFLKESGAALHVDDRRDLLNQIVEECPGIKTIWVSKARYSTGHLLVRSLQEALDLVIQGETRIAASLHSRSFESFWRVPD